MGNIQRIEAKKLIDNYLIFCEDKPELENNSNSIWFSLQEVEQFIAFAKEKAVEKNENLSGFSIIYGMYPEQRPTVLFMATSDGDALDQNQKDLEIELLNFGNNGWPPKKSI